MADKMIVDLAHGNLFIVIDSKDNAVGMYNTREEAESHCEEDSVIKVYVAASRIHLMRIAQQARVKEFNNVTATPINLAQLAVWQAKLDTLEALLRGTEKPNESTD